MEIQETATLIEAYAVLEQQIHQRVGEISGPTCSACSVPCCKPEHCGDVPESAWLRAVAEARGAAVPPAGTPEVSFLGETGCTLRAGWPPQCTWYICDDLELAIRDPLERYVYQVLSNVLGYVIRGLTRDMDLTDVETLTDLSDRQRAKVGRRIEEASACANAAWTLRSLREEQRPVVEVVESMLRIGRTFPFAGRRVRFAGERPSLSKAGRERGAGEK